jgi:hypothetical protein
MTDGTEGEGREEGKRVQISSPAACLPPLFLLFLVVLQKKPPGFPPFRPVMKNVNPVMLVERYFMAAFPPSSPLTVQKAGKGVTQVEELGGKNRMVADAHSWG